MKSGGVFICGMDVVSAAGMGLESVLQTMIQGDCPAGIGFVGELPKRSGGVPVYRIHDPLLEAGMPARVRHMDRTTQLAWRSVQSLVPDIHQWRNALGPDRLGVYFGTSRGPVMKQMESIEAWRNQRIRPSLAVDVPLASTSGYLSGFLELQGPSLTISATCCSGAHALVEAAQAIQSGRIDAAVVVAADAAIHPAVLGQMQVAGMLTEETVVPGHGCLPFDSARTGTALGEGAACVLLASGRVQNQLRSSPGIQLSGWHIAVDSHSRTLSDPDGLSLEKSMSQALHMAHLPPARISLISPHGTGTLYNDEVETRAFQRFLQEAGPSFPRLVPTKHFTGHCLGATSLMEVCFLASLLSGGGFPRLDYLQCPIVPERMLQGKEGASESALSVSLGFWGNLNALVLELVKP